jgi:hypothetical protein
MRIMIVLVGLSVGVALLWFRKEFAISCVNDQNRLWGFRFAEKTTRWTEVIVVIGGLAFIIAGLLALFGVGKFDW